MDTATHPAPSPRRGARGRKQICRDCGAERRGAGPWRMPRKPLPHVARFAAGPCTVGEGGCTPLPGFDSVPPARKLARDLRLDDATARLLRAVLRGEAWPEAAGERYEARERQLWRMSRTDRIELAADVLLETHGIESLASEDGETRFRYCNAGDPYAATLVFYGRAGYGGRVLVSTWGDEAERAERNGHTFA